MSYDAPVKGVQQVYFDEAGFTGPHLLDGTQPHFAYVGVALDESAASAAVAAIGREFRLDGSELKGSRLVKFARGRRAMSEIVAGLADRAWIVVHHKQYALAGKLFEYIYEPVLAPKSSGFYEIGLHRFVAGLLYLDMSADAALGNELLRAFQALVREGTPAAMDRLQALEQRDSSKSLRVVRHTLEFARIHGATIASELEGLHRASGEMDPWVLDLTTSALYSILAQMGLTYEQLSVTCDVSAPIEATSSFFDYLIGREDRVFSPFSDKTPVTFNLAGAINLVRSHESPGVQLADVLASAVLYCVENPGDKLAQEWARSLMPRLQPACVFPDVENLDPDSQGAFVNFAVLEELMQRSRTGRDLFEGMGEVAAQAAMLFEMRRLGYR